MRWSPSRPPPSRWPSDWRYGKPGAAGSSPPAASPGYGKNGKCPSGNSTDTSRTASRSRPSALAQAATSRRLCSEIRGPSISSSTPILESSPVASRVGRSPGRPGCCPLIVPPTWSVSRRMEYRSIWTRARRPSRRARSPANASSWQCSTRCLSSNPLAPSMHERSRSSRRAILIPYSLGESRLRHRERFHWWQRREIRFPRCGPPLDSAARWARVAYSGRLTGEALQRSSMRRFTRSGRCIGHPPLQAGVGGSSPGLRIARSGRCSLKTSRCSPAASRCCRTPVPSSTCTAWTPDNTSGVSRSRGLSCASAEMKLASSRCAKRPTAFCSPH